MSELPEISTAEEAVAARRRASQTQAELRAVFVALRRPGMSEHERAEKANELARLREQYAREIEPVRAFYKDLIAKAEKRGASMPHWARDELSKLRGEIESQ